jgi:hypothetical protein
LCHHQRATSAASGVSETGMGDIKRALVADDSDTVTTVLGLE